MIFNTRFMFSTLIQIEKGLSLLLFVFLCFSSFLPSRDTSHLQALPCSPAAPRLPLCLAVPDSRCSTYFFVTLRNQNQLIQTLPDAAPPPLSLRSVSSLPGASPCGPHRHLSSPLILRSLKLSYPRLICVLVVSWYDPGVVALPHEPIVKSHTQTHTFTKTKKKHTNNRHTHETLTYSTCRYGTDSHFGRMSHSWGEIRFWVWTITQCATEARHERVDELQSVRLCTSVSSCMCVHV